MFKDIKDTMKNAVEQKKILNILKGRVNVEPKSWFISTLELKLIFMELFDWTKDRECNNLQQLWNGMLIN